MNLRVALDSSGESTTPGIQGCLLPSAGMDDWQVKEKEKE
jgi:hypothetical protein